MGEPEERLIVASRSVLVFGESVLIKPDDLAPILKPDFVEVGLQETRVVMDRVNKQVTFWL